ncbi:hypothetical protein ACHAW5_010919 [Stephanodiscus triporus]|uniref:J domain-containing protein n=1 Tax=Stephanodiscus triporus TaxID=2934178 RepID=A0ABD3PBN7_9STRA
MLGNIAHGLLRRLPIRVADVACRITRPPAARRPVVVVVVRRLSTRGGGGDDDDGRRRPFQLDALPFTVRPSEAYAKFERWAIDEQGLGPLLSLPLLVPRRASVSLSASFAPFWYFDVNVRFVPPTKGGASHVVPEPLRSAYPDPPGGTMHVPGLASYAGFTYRRSLIDPVHGTSPVLLRRDVVPFRQWMLGTCRPLDLSFFRLFKGASPFLLCPHAYTLVRFRSRASALAYFFFFSFVVVVVQEPLEYDGRRLEVFPDPWNATREQAYSVIRDELRVMANEQYRERTGSTNDDDGGVRVETERLSSRRIYMPTYVVDYAVLGIPYRAIVSGCDPSMGVSGVSHRTLFSADSEGGRAMDGASSFLSDLPRRVAPAAAGMLQFFGPRPLLAIARAGWAVLSRVVMKVPVIGILGGAFVAWRKLLKPYMDDRSATAEWERRRDHESRTTASVHEDSFRDDGAARAYFVANEERILKSLSGEEGRHPDEREGSGWYKQWEAWAREQWETAQREASRAQEEFQRQQRQGRTETQYQKSRQQEQQQGRRQYKQAKKDGDFTWDFDVNDPWSVLGISRNSSKEEVSKAFRREMLKHHPDLQSQNSEKEKRRATERSKIISDAYRKIKASYAKR